MSSLVTHTRRQLSELNSPDEFELIATAVLREAVPEYASLLHVGTNVSGRTVRSPVDGIGVNIHRGSRKLLLVQHTITARSGLRRKWLDEKDGDVTKAKAIISYEIARGSVREGTLVLACTSDPDENLVRDVHAAAGDELKIDLWPGSRIADFLDRNPEGQWLRKQQFGTAAPRLSLSQAFAISHLSLGQYLSLVERSEIVPRALAADLVDFAMELRGVGFIIGESGLGKSTALRCLGDDWLVQGGMVLILSHEIIEHAGTIEQAITHGLRYWMPELDMECGHAALALATHEQPILLIVEDVNRSTNPGRIIERLVGWSVTSNSAVACNIVPQPWRLLCPVWPSNAGLGNEKLYKRVIGNSFMIDKFERSEAISAIRTRANAAGVELTVLQCNDLAMALGDDPLLIGLNNNWLKPSAREAIQSYCDLNIEEAADNALLGIDLRQALGELAEKMVIERTVYPKWHQIRNWLAGNNDILSAIRRLVKQGKIIQLGMASSDERLAYRHDRVRDYLLTRALKSLIERDKLTPELWVEPFYSGLIGGALPDLPLVIICKATAHNPVALFAALHAENVGEEHRDRLIEAANEWVASPSFKMKASERQRQHAMQYLARTDGAFVADLAKHFPFGFSQIEAMVRNGSVRAGASLCANSEPGLFDAWRDRILAHALSCHPNFVLNLAELIRDGDLSPQLLEGALNLAGEIGDSALCDALAVRWSSIEDRCLSTGWLWAALRCCPPISHPLAITLCDIWEKLPAKVKRNVDKSDANPRWDIAGYNLPWAFSRKHEPNAIAFMIARARSARKLSHVLSSILSKIDVPEAVIYSIQVGANVYRRTEKNGGISFFAHNLQRNWSPEQHGRTLSIASRTAVERIWRNRRINRFERKTAFLVWSQTPTRQEIAGLAMLESDPLLADSALRTRLAVGDQLAVPLLKQRIWNTERGQYWWLHARKVGLANLHEDVERYFLERRIAPLATSNVTDIDRILAELLIDEHDYFSINTILKNVDQFKTSPVFVQAALFLAVPETVVFAQAAIASSDSPEKMLEYIEMVWGMRTVGRAGVTNLAQLQALEPYYSKISEKNNGNIHIVNFFEAANSIGALGWRKKHLDPIISKTRGDYCTSDKQTLFFSLDSEVANFLKYKRSWFFIEQWFRRREEELWSRKDLLAVVGEWCCDRGSESAVALLCEVLLYFGERDDLTLLDSLAPALHISCTDVIANCIYEVQRRSLSRI